MKRFVFLALLLAFALPPAQAQLFKGLFKKKVPVADSIAGMERLGEVMNLIQTQYVSDPNTDHLSEEAIRHMLRTLDPHSIYIPAREVQRTNEALQGNFEGVGITFAVVDDTIRVQEVLAGGPAEKVGLLRGDKFLRIDGISATGDSAVNSFVFRHLRGKKGTIVVADMLRGSDSITFHIERDRIPIHSIEVYFMEDDSIGYISLLRFARFHIGFSAASISLAAAGIDFDGFCKYTDCFIILPAMQISAAQIDIMPISRTGSSDENDRCSSANYKKYEQDDHRSFI